MKDRHKNWLLVLLPLLLNACTPLAPPATRHAGAQEIQDILEAAADDAVAQAAAKEPPVVEGDDPESSASRVAAESSERRFDLAVESMVAPDFFQALVADTDFNVVVHPGVKGTVSLDLTQVSVTEVMGLMRDVYGFDSVLQGRTYQIYPDVLRTEIFQVDYLNVTRTGHSEMQVSAGKVTDAAAGVGGVGFGGAGGFLGAGAGGINVGGVGMQQGAAGAGGVVGTMVNTDGSSDFWVELETTLGAIVAGDQGAQVVVTPQAGLVVVRAKPDSLSAVRSYLSRVENSLHRQVILEAKILEVTLKEGFQAGINWNTFGDAAGGSFLPTTRVDENGLVVTTVGSEHSAAGEFRFGGTGEFFNPTGSTFALFGDFGDFSAVISLLETQGVVQVLSSPRIATVNNQKAVIKVGDDEFFVTDISTNTVTAGNAINVNDSPELTPFFSGIALDVTPQISERGEVILHVHPTVSEVREQIKTIRGEPVPLAASTIRESDSIIRALSGQVVVIGGLMQNSSTDESGSVPFLGDLPLAGHLFRQRVSGNTKSELVILLRPVVVNADSQAEWFRRSAGRVGTLRDQIGSD
jgi:MSHA biogenesis protein MshL